MGGTEMVRLSKHAIFKITFVFWIVSCFGLTSHANRYKRSSKYLPILALPVITIKGKLHFNIVFELSYSYHNEWQFLYFRI